MRLRFLILLFLLPFFTKAQQLNVPADTTQQETQAIPLAEIPSQAERVIQKINKEYQQQISKSPMQGVRLLIDSLISTSSDLVHLSDLLLNQDIPYFVLETAINRWNRFVPLIVKEESQLKDYSTQLSEISDELSDTNKRWLLLKSKETEEAYPEAIENRLKKVLGMIDSVKLVLNDSLSKCLGLQNTLVDIQISSEAYLKKLTDYKTQTISELLTSQNAPIWAMRQNADSVSTDLNLNVLISYSKEDIGNYFKQDQRLFFLVFVLFIVFWLAMLWMKRKYNELQAKDVEELELGKYIFSKAATTAFLFTIIAQSLILSKKPYALILVTAIIVFLLFIAIIPGLVIKPLKWSVYFLSIVFLFVNFDLLFFHFHNSIQIISLAESLGVLAFLSWFLLNESRIRPQDYERSVWFKFLSITGPIYFLLMIIAILANVTGFVYFSRLINLGVVNSALIWLLLAVAYRIIEGLSYLFLETNFALKSRIVLSRRKDILSWIRFLFHKILLLLWVYYTLQTLMVWDQVYKSLLDIWNWGIKTENVDFSVGNVLSFLLIVIISWGIANIVKLLLQVEILSRFKLSRGVPMAIASVTNYTLIIIGFFIALSFAGFDLTKISFIIGTLGVGIGFSLQSIVSNFISGLILIFERPITIGDVIIVENIEGTVTNIGSRSSTVLLYNGDEEIIPNALLVSGRVTNRTLSSKHRRFLIVINTALETNPDLVIELLQKASKEVPGVLSYPEAKAYFNGITQQSLQFYLYYWVGENFMDVVSKTNLKAHQYLRENGIQIPIPRQIEYHLEGLKDEDLLPKQHNKKEEKDPDDKQS